MPLVCEEGSTPSSSALSGRGQTLLSGLEHSADGLGRQLLLALLAVTYTVTEDQRLVVMFRVSCLSFGSRVSPGFSWVRGQSLPT